MKSIPVIFYFPLVAFAFQVCGEIERRPQINTRELASFENIHWVKGEIPNLEGYKIKSVQLFLKDASMEPISEIMPIEYFNDRYVDTGELMDPLSYLSVMIKPVSDGFRFNIRFEGSNIVRSLTGYEVKLKSHRVVRTQSFSGSTGMTSKDFHYVVSPGDNTIFILTGPNNSRKELILRCEPDDTDNPVNSPENPNNHSDD